MNRRRGIGVGGRQAQLTTRGKVQPPSSFALYEFSSVPASQEMFFHDKSNREMSVADYYREFKGINLLYPNMPCACAKPTNKKAGPSQIKIPIVRPRTSLLCRHSDHPSKQSACCTHKLENSNKIYMGVGEFLNF